MSRKGFSREGFDAIVNEAMRSKGVRKAVFDSAMGLEGFIENVQRSAPLNIAEGQSLHPADETIQRDIRKAFGRSGTNDLPIGTHPDFEELQGTKNVELHHICSLFLDIKNSTRLSLLYPLTEVVWIKDSILRAAAETVRGMDGIVHRFMGDALLAFFGRKGVPFEDSVVNAINCAAVLEALMVGTIIPYLADHNVDANYLGFRIGLDFGDDKQVLWSSYGVEGVTEITATSFYVDVAAKLQSMARKNTAMIGENIISAIDFPDSFSCKKKIKRGGEIIEIDYLNKSYSDAEGNQHRYKVREIVHSAYRDLLPYPLEERADFAGSRLVNSEHISFKCFVTGAGSSTEYRSVSRCLSKGQSLEFHLTLNSAAYNAYDFPLKVVLQKRNHGVEAKLHNDAGVFPKPPEMVSVPDKNFITRFFNGKTLKFSEGTKYKGLHTMEATVHDANGAVIFRDVIGIFIK
nr:hypothetical protein [uncultured Pseudomonas sp.]